MNEYLMTLIGSTITGVISFFFGVQRSKAELQGMELGNVSKSLEIYTTIINDLKSQIEELLEKVDDLEVKVEELKQENHELKQMLRERQSSQN